jgi:hypothetical protein
MEVTTAKPRYAIRPAADRPGFVVVDLTLPRPMEAPIANRKTRAAAQEKAGELNMKEHD